MHRHLRSSLGTDHLSCKRLRVSSTSRRQPHVTDMVASSFLPIRVEDEAAVASRICGMQQQPVGSLARCILVPPHTISMRPGLRERRLKSGEGLRLSILGWQRPRSFSFAPQSQVYFTPPNLELPDTCSMHLISHVHDSPQRVTRDISKHVNKC